MTASDVTYEDIAAARERIADGIYASPCPHSAALSEIVGCDVYCKLDYLQRTGSFKERGARNALMLLDDDQKKRGVVAASAGNHALGLAHHGKSLGVPVTVVMPTYAPLVKVTTCRSLGAIVINHGDSFDEAIAHAQTLVESDGLTYINGYDDAAIIAGQGTMALEILEQVADLDAVVIPIGGAGLIAGCALAIKHANPEIEVIGVEAEHAASYSAALEAGEPVKFDTQPTLADGLAVNRVGARAFAIARQHVDRVVVANESAIALAILRLIEREKGVVEGAAASTLAALLDGKLDDLRGKRIALALCGGNIDPGILADVIEKGLVADGRLTRFTATISDRPGGLASFTAVLAEQGVSVKQITHDRAFNGADVAAVNVLCVVETRDADHVRALHEAMSARNIEFTTHD